MNKDNCFGTSIRSQLETPFWLRGLTSLTNCALRVACCLGFRPCPDDIDELCRLAEKTSGLSNWGDDRKFREGAEILLEIHRTRLGAIAPLAMIIVQKMLLEHLVVRLQLENFWHRYPEVLDRRIEAPLFIVALPRTGTTHLHRLLALDPANRAPLHWELNSPVPPEKLDDKDQRIERMTATIRMVRRYAPGFDSIHPLNAVEPEECIPLLARTFVSDAFARLFPDSRYGQWLREQDMLPVYRYHRRQLQTLQDDASCRKWLLKCPLHLGNLESIKQVYPDARFIQIHRDPVNVIPSLCSLIGAFRELLCDRIDPILLGESTSVFFDDDLRKSIDVRKRIEPNRFYDLSFNEFIRNPVDAVAKIYRHFELPFDENFVVRMQSYLKTKRTADRNRISIRLKCLASRESPLKNDLVITPKNLPTS